MHSRWDNSADLGVLWSSPSKTGCGYFWEEFRIEHLVRSSWSWWVPRIGTATKRWNAFVRPKDLKVSIFFFFFCCQFVCENVGTQMPWHMWTSEDNCSGIGSSPLPPFFLRKFFLFFCPMLYFFSRLLGLWAALSCRLRSCLRSSGITDVCPHHGFSESKLNSKGLFMKCLYLLSHLVGPWNHPLNGFGHPWGWALENRFFSCDQLSGGTLLPPVHRSRS